MGSQKLAPCQSTETMSLHCKSRGITRMHWLLTQFWSNMWNRWDGLRGIVVPEAQRCLMNLRVIFCIIMQIACFVLCASISHVDGVMQPILSDNIAIFKSAIWSCLADEESEKIDENLSCSDPAVLVAYPDCAWQVLLKAAVRLWKFIIPKEAREVFKKEDFHPTSVSGKLQGHFRTTDAHSDFSGKFQYV